MGLMDKIKNMFTEEEEIEEEPIKKEVIQVEIPSPMPRKEEKKVEQVKVQEKVEKIAASLGADKLDYLPARNLKIAFFSLAGFTDFVTEYASEHMETCLLIDAKKLFKA